AVVAVRDARRAAAAGIPEALLTDAPAHLVASPDVDIVVELIGGDEPARTLIAAALAAGKPVVTANKHVIARHGPVLEALARSAGSALRFEAAVAGGIPILGALGEGLAANRIERVRGIVNGTTNFILTAMAERRRPYAASLVDAQRAGYAEADPAGDVEGDDARNKLVILARLAFGEWLDPASIEPRPATVSGLGRAGISGVSLEEVLAAAAHGLRLKLLVDARRPGDPATPGPGIEARVQPVALAADSGFGRTGGIGNRIEVEAAPLGRFDLAGPGAGGGPTSSAVLADLVAIARGAGSTWAGLAPASERAAEAVPADPDAARRWFFQSVLPEQLIRDQLDLEAAAADGFVTVAQPLGELRAGLGALGIEATLYPIEDVA
ncbi:MAG: homoserine dehydrogenase, partial [Candidatus Limnocylindrales bacterium]